MLNIEFTHTSSSSSSAKLFTFGLKQGKIATKVPPQAQDIIRLTQHLAKDKPQFTYNDVIDYIDECCAYHGTVFTRSKGGTERIVRYYAKLLQELKVFQPVDEAQTEALKSKEVNDKLSNL